jgi:arylsulfatase A
MKVALILSELTAQGLDEDTIVIFASDNGAHSEGGHDYTFFASSGPLNGFKRSLHEGGHRSAIFVRWSGVAPAGVISEQQWAFYDFMATAADIAGVSPALVPVNDGYSILPTLKGQTQAQPAFIYHEYCQPNEQPGL